MPTDEELELELYERFQARIDDMTVESPPRLERRSTDLQIARPDDDVDEDDLDEELEDDEVEEPERSMDPLTRDRVLRMALLDRAAFDPERLHHYWTRGEGLAKWVKSPHPWTTLHRHLVKYVGPERAKRMASEWFHEVFGFYSGSDINRVVHGKPPRGKRIGPG